MRKYSGRRHPAMVALKMAVWLALGALVVWAAMLLWNWLLPALFTGVHTIDYWQTLGLIVLCRLLFGGGGRGRWGARRRWHNMTDEERTQFKQRFKDGRCGRDEASR